MSVRRVYVEKRDGYDFEARDREADFRNNLGMPVEKVRVLHRYDVEGLSDEQFEQACVEVLGDGATANIYFEDIPDLKEGDQVIASEYKPGQFNQRAMSASQIIALMNRSERPRVRYAKVFVIEGGDVEKIKEYLINREDAREATLDKFTTLEAEVPPAKPVQKVEGFRTFDTDQLKKFLEDGKYAMSLADAEYAQEYFRKENRDPTETELRVVDAYWSDHCRHTTFSTILDKVEFADNEMSQRAKEVYDEYLQARREVSDSEDVSLMDIATMYLRETKYSRRLNALDDSDEINASSFRQTVETDQGEHPYLIMFKNETRNSPTEADPLGGSATCLGGVIRDPMVGRAYTYQAMRVSGSGDPREPASEALEGHLPQRLLSRQSARGFSNYSKGVGVPTGLVDEVYHPGYKAKHMEIGAVIGAVPERNVNRRTPMPGDLVILLGGRTGRDGVGQASSSSTVAHPEALDEGGGINVQKGDPLTERKLQRLIRNPEFVEQIKRANDFGAGGVAVAVAELGSGVEVNLDEMPVKYPGLDGTELATSESQERIAVVVDAKDADQVIKMATAENIRANVIAKITNDGRLRLNWNGEKIVDLSQAFLDANGAPQYAQADVDLSDFSDPFAEPVGADFEQTLLQTLGDVNVGSKKGMQTMFDATVGAGTVSMPLGGKNQVTPIQAMCALVPCPGEISRTATLMSYGLDPYLLEKNPFGGAIYALVDSIAKVVASGAQLKDCWLSLQEYFPSLGNDPKKWGKPLAALLGAYMVQKGTSITAIGGKDSMNGTCGTLEVPPTLCSFCVATVDAERVITPEFKKPGNKLYLLRPTLDKDNLPVLEDLVQKYEGLSKLIEEEVVVSAYAVGRGGYLAGAAKSAFGNGYGVKLFSDSLEDMTRKLYGAVLVEASEIHDPAYELVGEIRDEKTIDALGQSVPMDKALDAYMGALDSVFPMVRESEGTLNTPVYEKKWSGGSAYPTAIPRVIIPVFPGATCEFDTFEAFRRVGAIPRIVVIRNQTPNDLQESLAELASAIEAAQIIVLPGGSTASDEPDGSGKMMATAFRHGPVNDATMEFINYKDGLILGISNGFQALIRLGLVPYGEIREPNVQSPTLTTNEVGRHVSTLVRVRITSADSPWLQFMEPGSIQTVAVSHTDGRFMAPKGLAKQLARDGRIAAQYVDPEGNPTMDPRYNPSGSMLAVEALLSPNGRVMGMMGHRERAGRYTARNVPGEMDLMLFAGAISYFK